MRIRFLLVHVISKLALELQNGIFHHNTGLGFSQNNSLFHENICILLLNIESRSISTGVNSEISRGLLRALFAIFASRHSYFRVRGTECVHLPLLKEVDNEWKISL